MKKAMPVEIKEVQVDQKVTIAKRPYVMSIAGFDPSAGAGLLADIKCFEQHKVYGFGVCSALTVQTDASFISCQWIDASKIIGQLVPIIDKFSIVACKIGLVKDLAVLLEVISFIKSINEHIKIILDPVLQSSSGYSFHDWNLEHLMPVLSKLELITPNYQEMQRMGNSLSAEQTAAAWSTHCPVLLKGGHNETAPGRDILFQQDKVIEIETTLDSVYEKHGSGCVLSAAITANLSLGYSLEEACRLGKIYTAQFLQSNSGLLGYHLV